MTINYKAIRESLPPFQCFVSDLILGLNENNIEKKVRGTPMSHIIIDMVIVDKLITSSSRSKVVYLIIVAALISNNYNFCKLASLGDIFLEYAYSSIFF